MAGLSATARAAIRAAGFTQVEWAVMWGYRPGEWGGDACGCRDPRCANGYHHYGADDCGCLETMLADAVAWRAATLEPNSVALTTPPNGLYQWVNVSIPGRSGYRVRDSRFPGCGGDRGQDRGPRGLDGDRGRGQGRADGGPARQGGNGS